MILAAQYAPAVNRRQGLWGWARLFGPVLRASPARIPIGVGCNDCFPHVAHRLHP